MLLVAVKLQLKVVKSMDQGSGIRKGINMKASPMSDEFHDWLDQCPVMWFRGEVTKDHVTYIFETPEENEEEN